jgi:hypothetical protein
MIGRCSERQHRYHAGADQPERPAPATGRDLARGRMIEASRPRFGVGIHGPTDSYTARVKKGKQAGAGWVEPITLRRPRSPG